MITELDTVALNRSFSEYRLQAGDTGTVVDISPDGKWFMVEFITNDGRTIALETFEADAMRPIGEREITQSRIFA